MRSRLGLRARRLSVALGIAIGLLAFGGVAAGSSAATHVARGASAHPTAHVRAVGLPPGASSVSGSPRVSRFLATPATLTKAGGTTVLKGTASNAASCTLTVSPTRTGFPKTLKPCASISTAVKLPANKGTKPIFYTFTLSAKQGASTVRAVAMTVVAGSAKPVKSLTLPSTLTKNTELSPAVASVYVLPAAMVTVPSALTLVVAPGTIVKATPNPGSFVLDVAGTMNAVGTSGSPVTFTSRNDNSVGGATGTGHPQATDWGGIRTEATGTIDLEYAKVKYASDGVVAHGTSTIRNTAFTAIGSKAVATVSGDHLALSLASIAGPSGSVVTVSGTVTSSSTLGASALPWFPDCLSVASGVTLTVQAGAIVKLSNTNPCGVSGGINVAGTLSAVGTNVSPITFTSINDNSIGGATGTGSPAATDWSGIRSESSGSIDLEHAAVKYTSGPNNAAIDANGVTTTILNDTFDTIGENGVSVHGGTVNVSSNQFTNLVNAGFYGVIGTDTGSAFTMKNNTTDSSAAGFYIVSSHFNFNNITGNTGPSGTGLIISGTVATSSTLAASTMPWVIIDCVSVASGVTLTVQPGAIVKSGHTNVCVNGGSINVSGTLSAVGTSGSPITFTSINDNSIGGATGTGSPANDWSGIRSESSGSLDIEHAVIKYLLGWNSAAVDANGVTTTILNNTFDTIYGHGVLVHGGTVNVSSNHFTNLVTAGFFGVEGTDTGSAFTMKNNTVDSGAGFWVSGDHLNLDNTTGNSGPSGAGVAISGTVTTSSTLAASTMPWEILLASCLQVPTGVTLTVQAGAIVKSNANGCVSSSAIDVSGTLSAIGTIGSPITFTSINDNSIGGATGTGTPHAGDWGGIHTVPGGVFNCTFCTHSYD